ncbi:MAG: response regulator [Flavobacterium sp.]|nr:response regulator [Flavobacterium sp.]
MELKVLMVDDHPPIIEGYRSILADNSFGYILNTTAVHSCEAAYKEVFQAKDPFDIVFLDMTLPPYSEKNINTGDDLVPIVRKLHPNAKILILTSHYESIVLFKIIKDHNPQGILIKSDLQPQELIDAFDIIVKGGTYYSKTVMNHQKSWSEKNKVMDSYNRQILFLLAQGVKTKSLPDLLHLSKSAIDKRKAILKQLLGIDKGNDEDILKEARKQGLI